MAKGYELIDMEGTGKKAIYNLVPLNTDSMPGEEWKNFPLAPDYLVSNMGRIKNPKGHLIPGTNNKGYVRTRIGDLGQLSNHRIVMLTFNPIDKPENFSVDHINGIRNDNRVENLRWVWQSENMSFAVKNNSSIKELIALLIQKYGYEETCERLLALLNEE